MSMPDVHEHLQPIGRCGCPPRGPSGKRLTTSPSTGLTTVAAVGAPGKTQKPSPIIFSANTGSGASLMGFTSPASGAATVTACSLPKEAEHHCESLLRLPDRRKNSAAPSFSRVRRLRRAVPFACPGRRVTHEPRASGPSDPPGAASRGDARRMQSRPAARGPIARRLHTVMGNRPPIPAGGRRTEGGTGRCATADSGRPARLDCAPAGGGAPRCVQSALGARRRRSSPYGSRRSSTPSSTPRSTWPRPRASSRTRGWRSSPPRRRDPTGASRPCWRARPTSPWSVRRPPSSSTTRIRR